MLASERYIYIKQQLDLKRVLNLKEVSNKLGVSESTIRRDFEELEKQGLVQKVYGGVIKSKLLSTLSDKAELTMTEKIVINGDTKRKLCFEAAQLVKDGDCVFVDGGTSLMYMIDFLFDKDIKIVTHSSLITQNVQNIKAEIIMVGGRYIPNYKMNVGPVAIDILEKFNFDYAFIGCTGIDAKDRVAYTADMDSALIKQVAIKKSLSNYLLVDSSKLNVRGFYEFTELKSFDAIFTDNYPNDIEKIDNLIICKDEDKDS